MRLPRPSAWPAEAPALAVMGLAGLLLAHALTAWLPSGAPGFPPPPGPAPAAAATRTAPPGPATAPEADRLDLNLADEAALQTLPGIGPTLAQRIVAHRSTHGRFARPEELQAVPGIGAARWAKLAPHVRVSQR